MNLSGVQEFLWAAGSALDCILLAVLCVRRRSATFPAFTFLIAFYVVRTAVTYPLALRFGIHAHPYFYTYWLFAFVDEAIQLAVFYELAVHVFCPTGTWAPDTKRAFQWLIVASVVCALGLTLLASPSAKRPYQTFLLRSNFLTSALMSELFVGIMVLSVSAGLPWKTHVARIAQGLGAYSLVTLVLEAARNYFGVANGQHTYIVLGNAIKFSYLACDCYWIAMLWRDAPAPRELPDAMLMQIYTLQRRMEDDLARIRNWRQS